MFRSRAALVAMIPVGLLLGSCGRGEGPALYPVRGQVTYKGRPAVGATVSLVSEGGEPQPPGKPPIIPSGEVDEQGNFALESGDLGSGAPVGKYKVLIQWRTRAGEAVAPQSAPKKGRQKVVKDKPDGIPDRLEGRYMKAEGGRLHAEVKPEKNELPPFDVSN